MRALLRMLPIVASHRALFIETVLWSVVSQGAALGIALGLAASVGRVMADEPLALQLPAMGLVTIGVIAALSAWRESWVSHDLAYRIIGDLRRRVFDVLRRALPARRRPRRSGDLTTTVMADIETLEWLYAHTAAQAIGAMLVLTASIVVSAAITPLLMLVWMPLLTVGVVVPALTARRARADGDALAAGASTLRAELLDTVRGLRELIGADALYDQADRLADDTRTLARVQIREAARLGLERGIADITLALAALGAVVIVVLERESVAGADVPLAITVAVAGLAPAAQIADLLRNTGTLRAAAERIDEVLSMPAAVSSAVSRPARRAEDGLVFERVSFSYDDEPPIVEDLSLHVERGEIVVLTGPSGAGKTTVARLAQRLWDPDRGRIRVDGIDLRALTDGELRSRIAVVPQSSPLLRGTIRSNIVLGDPDALPEAIERVADVTGLRDPHSGLPLGLDTPVGEHGSGVSGGQRARVAIARALLRNPRVLILDEATASLDPEADAAVMSVLRRVDDRTVLLIAHRPETIAAADRRIDLSSRATTSPL